MKVDQVNERQNRHEGDGRKGDRIPGMNLLAKDSMDPPLEGQACHEAVQDCKSCEV